MDNITDKTVYLLVTCCLDNSRKQLLQELIDQFKSQINLHGASIDDHLWAFDNGSLDEFNVKEIVTNLVKPDRVFYADKNYGYWSAINWFLKYLDRSGLNKQYEYIHLIESDLSYFAINKFKMCELALDRYQHLGSIRCAELQVANAHLYDKNKPSRQSKKNIWSSQKDIHGNKVTFTKLDTELDLYETKFLSFLPHVSRLATMQSIFSKLEAKSRFLEPEYSQIYHESYQATGLIDGGIFNCDLPSYATATKGSEIINQNKTGYKETRCDTICSVNNMVICTK